jgi:hypothetical protein
MISAIIAITWILFWTIHPLANGYSWQVSAGLFFLMVVPSVFIYLAGRARSRGDIERLVEHAAVMDFERVEGVLPDRANESWRSLPDHLTRQIGAVEDELYMRTYSDE